jgi:predicted nucleic acid-binding protein
MSYLIDTNTISEMRKINCNPNVKAYIDALPQDDIYISVVTLGEIMKGIEKTTDNEKKAKLFSWFENIFEWFEENIVNVDSDVMIEWGKLVVRHKQTLPAMDSLLAATCLTHHFTLLTRNVKDFTHIAGIDIINPWEYQTI